MDEKVVAIRPDVVVKADGAEAEQNDVPEVDQNVVAALEELMEAAKAGKLQGIAFVGLNENDEVFSGHRGSISIGLIGAITMLGFRVTHLFNALVGH